MIDNSNIADVFFSTKNSVFINNGEIVNNIRINNNADSLSNNNNDENYYTDDTQSQLSLCFLPPH